MKNNLNKIFIYFFSFLTYCFIGWIYEVMLEYFIYHHGFVNRGFLYGPYLPIYGFGAVILLILLKNIIYKKRYIKKINISPIITFIFIFLITTIIEYFAGVTIYNILAIRLWDYSNYKFNLNGFICLSASLRFAFGGTILAYFVQPLIEKGVNNLKIKTQRHLTIIFSLIMISDLLITLLKYI